MILVLQFDYDADIIDVPQIVIDNRNQLQKRFLNWLYDRKSKHCYWKKTQYGWGVIYRSDAFIEWLNKKKYAPVTIVKEHVYEYDPNLPTLFF